MIILRLARKSLFNRSISISLSILLIALSVFLVLSVEKIRHGARQGFLQTISGTDLVVGARTGSAQLLLSTVFRIGNATNTISMESLEAIEHLPAVDWLIPISLGDSYRGFSVLGTTTDYFDYYRYGRKEPLVFAQGQRFEATYDLVLGAAVAKKLGHKLGDSIVLAHGAGRVTFISHDEKPFTVSGILAPTGTPVDQTVHISLHSMEAIHDGWEAGASTHEREQEDAHEDEHGDETDEDHDHDGSVTAAFIGLHSRIESLSLQREINEYEGEPLSAVLPAVALAELWQIISLVEKVLFAISLLVVGAAIISMIIVMVSTLDARRREMAILRAVGARPWHIFALFVAESGLIALVGILVGFVLTNVFILAIQDTAQSLVGVQLALGWPSATEGLFVIGLAGVAILGGLLPALYATRLTLADGLAVRN